MLHHAGIVVYSKLLEISPGFLFRVLEEVQTTPPLSPPLLNPSHLYPSMAYLQDVDNAEPVHFVGPVPLGVNASIGSVSDFGRD